MIGMIGQNLAEAFLCRWCKLLPGDDRAQTVAGGIPRVAQGRHETKGKRKQ
jgi:hypothetical protein